MNSIFVIDKDINECVESIDFIPQKESRIILNDLEYKVNCIVYNPKEHATLIFVTPVEKYYSKLVKEIKWNM
jgi:hypothetical protein